MNIVIIGAGEIGRAMEKILKEKPDSPNQIFLWDKNPDKVSGQKSLEEIIVRHEQILFFFVFLLSRLKNF